MLALQMKFDEIIRIGPDIVVGLVTHEKRNGQEVVQAVMSLGDIEFRIYRDGIVHRIAIEAPRNVRVNRIHVPVGQEIAAAGS